MEPLYALEDGARRIRSNELTRDIVYTGDLEFENVCATFNDMQRHILSEQEKNHRYEKARTDMIARISHDLRTPLTAIRGMIKGLLDGVVAAPEQQERFLKAAYKRTGDMDLLLNQLFYLSKLQTGSMPLSLQNVEIAAFLQKYVCEKEEFMEALKEQITLETDGITAEVLVDMQQLGRILDNLLENSEKYSGAASLNIKLTLQKEADGTKVAETLENGNFDLILLDLMLPGKRGYEVCREIRDKWDIPILMVTARTESMDKIRGLGLGADDLYCKTI